MKQLFRLVTKYWLWVCIEPVQRTILVIHISNERNMFVAENAIRSTSSNLVSKQFTQLVIHCFLRPVHFYI